MNEKIFSVIKFFCVAYLVFIVPKGISHYFASSDPMHRNLRVLLGIENFMHSLPQHKKLKYLKFGMICNASSVDQRGNRSIDLLKDGGFSVKKLFISKEYEALGKKLFVVNNGVEVKTKIKTYFFDKDLKDLLKKNARDIDALFVDLQDGGIARKVTGSYITDLLTFAAKYKKKLIVFDRPNPFGGVIEGPGSIPWRHGLTVGELMHYYNRYVVANRADISVIPLKGWRRNWGLFGFSFCSSNVSATDIVRFSNALNLESKSLGFLNPIRSIKPIVMPESYDKQFQPILFSEKGNLSPWETRYFKRVCRKLGLHCCDYKKDNGENLDGVKIRLKSDVSKFSAFNSLMTILRFLNNRKQLELTIAKDFDDSIGSSAVRSVLQGEVLFSEFKKEVEKTLVSFYHKSKHCFLYKPLPRIVSPELIKV